MDLFVTCSCLGLASHPLDLMKNLLGLFAPLAFGRVVEGHLEDVLDRPVVITELQPRKVFEHLENRV